MAFHRQVALADAAARIGAIEHRQMLSLEAGRAFQGHGAGDEGVGLVDLGLGEAEAGQHVEGDVVELLGGEAEFLDAEFFAQGEFVEDEADVETPNPASPRPFPASARRSPWRPTRRG